MISFTDDNYERLCYLRRCLYRTKSEIRGTYISEGQKDMLGKLIRQLNETLNNCTKG